MIKCAIFDLDGTLIDSLPDLLDAMNRMLKAYDCRQIDRATAIKHIGRGAEEYIYGCLPDDKKYLTDECNIVYRKMLDESSLELTNVFEGLDTVLKTLKQKDIKLAILTNKPDSSTRLVYEKYLKNYDFDFVCGQKDSDIPKPDTTQLFNILDTLNIKKCEAVMIGDGEADAQVAINGGINQISVLWGYRTKQQLLDAGAKNFAADTKELLDLILKM